MYISPSSNVFLQKEQNISTRSTDSPSNPSPSVVPVAVPDQVISLKTSNSNNHIVPNTNNNNNNNGNSSTSNIYNSVSNSNDTSIGGQIQSAFARLSTFASESPLITTFSSLKSNNNSTNNNNYNNNSTNTNNSNNSSFWKKKGKVIIFFLS